MDSPLSEELSSEHALLGFLAYGPRHGYDIYQELSDPDGLWMVWRMKQSRLYAMLARLEDHGLLTSSMEPQEGRPPRKMYALTAAGRAAYRAWIKTPVEHGRQFRLCLLTRLFFARREGPQAVEELIGGQRAACREWLCDLEESIDTAAEGASFKRLVFRYRSGQVEAMLDWLDSCEDEFAPAEVRR